MKNKTILTMSVALLVAATTSQATIFFQDTFSAGSTINSLSPADPTLNSAAYQESSNKGWQPNPPTISSGLLKWGANDTTSGGGEIQTLFTTNPVTLVLPGDYVQLTVVFTNVWLAVANCDIGFGLYNGNQVAPLPGGLNGDCLSSVSDKEAGGVKEWVGYVGHRGTPGGDSTRIYLRASQSSGTANNNQNLTSAGSSSQSYRNPAATTISTDNTASGNLTNGATYTVVLRIDLIAANTLAITNTYYAGPDTNGAVLGQFGGQASGANFLTSSFDGIGIGFRARAHQDASNPHPGMEISSITVDGSVTVVSAPPDIVTQPVSVTVPSGAACAFSVEAQGFGMSYQWQRYGTNLVDGGNISGATSDKLIISPASAADVASGGNGYRVTVAGAGNYTTNSAFASLALGAAKNLVWAGTSANWDLGTTANWLNGVTPATFNFGDAVTFNDSGVGSLYVNLVDDFLSASTVKIDTTSGYDYIFDGPGSIAGPGSLIYQGAGFLTMNNANTHTGGTIISNASAYLVLNNYSALGTGPVVLAKAGGTMEIVPTGGSTTGIKGDVNVQDDFTIVTDGTGAFATVILGNLGGTPGKTLTFTPADLTTTNRYRVYGGATSCDANIVLNGPATSEAVYYGTTLAPYQNSGGVQSYNGVISGNGGIVQRAGGLTVLGGQNTYTGGTTPTTGTIGFGANTVGSVTSGPIGTGPLFINPEAPNTTGSGSVLAFGGARTIANPLQYSSGTNNQTLIVAGTNDLTFSGPYTLNGNDGSTTYTTRTLQVDNTGVTTLAGVVSGVGFGFTKTGSGELAMSANNSYSGTTTVSAGTLILNGSLAGAVAVSANATLGGSGTINGATTVAAGAIVAPGNSIGTLTINNDLTLAGDLSIEVNRTGSACDKVQVSGTLTNTGVGTITVVNNGAALQAGDTFALFNKAVANGDALAVTGGSVLWTNKLAIDGTIAVMSTVATTPTNIDYSLTGNNLTITWPANYLTWVLQSNSVDIASSANWFPVPGSESVTQFSVTVDPVKPQVFYRLVSP